MSIDQQKRLPPGQQLAAPGKWPVIGEKHPAPPPAVWTLAVTGLVERPQTFSLDQLTALGQVNRTLDIHCVTRWSIFDMNFTGVPLQQLLESVVPTSKARFVSFIAHSNRNHSTSLVLKDSLQLGTLIATHANGIPIPSEHGGPLRNIVPGRYFYKSVKWLKEIRLLCDDELGMWERESGYHNVADPWMEQRYIAPTIDKRTASQLIDSRDFSGRDLRSILASGLDLAGLRAREALLRDADFRQTNLKRADFTGANLSNAHFEFADLSGANFAGADVEGASFNGAVLAGVDLSSASLIGSSFTGEVDGKSVSAIIDSSTRFRRDSLESLSEQQREFLLASPAGFLDG